MHDGRRVGKGRPQEGQLELRVDAVDWSLRAAKVSAGADDLVAACALRVCRIIENILLSQGCPGGVVGIKKREVVQK